MLTAPTSSALFVVVANEDNENRAVGLVVSTQHLGERVSHPIPVDTNILLTKSIKPFTNSSILILHDPWVAP